MRARTDEDRGAYLLVLEMRTSRNIRVGALGILGFEPGLYIYAGSALGSLGARVRRHFAAGKTMHWHIDYLRQSSRPVEALVLRGKEKMECMLNEMVSSLEGARPYAPGFGCSDCSCTTHLHLVEDGTLRELESYLPERLLPGPS
ncbi:MAG: GIY-YIG nuclease family protein [Methanomassiliicoccales archaeon]|nr:GIY-YIG nuclease family protein [Methanomassiliicoccales archaeon]